MSHTGVCSSLFSTLYWTWDPGSHWSVFFSILHSVLNMRSWLTLECVLLYSPLRTEHEILAHTGVCSSLFSTPYWTWDPGSHWSVFFSILHSVLNMRSWLTLECVLLYSPLRTEMRSWLTLECVLLYSPLRTEHEILAHTGVCSSLFSTLYWTWDPGSHWSVFVTGCEAVKEEGRTQMHNVMEKGFNKGPDRQYIKKTM